MKQKSDFYTKFILTVIAIFLGVLVFQNVNLVERANAAQIPTPTSTNKEVIDVNIVKVNGYSFYGKYLPTEEK